MSIVTWIAFFPVALYLFLVQYGEALADLIDDAWMLMVEAVRKWRLYLVRKHGRCAFEDIAEEFRELAVEEGFDLEGVEEVLAEREAEIVERLGQRYVDAVFGEMDLEKYLY